MTHALGSYPCAQNCLIPFINCVTQPIFQLIDLGLASGEVLKAITIAAVFFAGVLICSTIIGAPLVMFLCYEYAMRSGVPDAQQKIINAEERAQKLERLKPEAGSILERDAIIAALAKEIRLHNATPDHKKAVELQNALTIEKQKNKELQYTVTELQARAITIKAGIAKRCPKLAGKLALARKEIRKKDSIIADYSKKVVEQVVQIKNLQRVMGFAMTQVTSPAKAPAKVPAKASTVTDTAPTRKAVLDKTPQKASATAPTTIKTPVHERTPLKASPTVSAAGAKTFAQKQ